MIARIGLKNFNNNKKRPPSAPRPPHHLQRLPLRWGRHFLLLKFPNKFLQTLQGRNWICYTPVMPCYKEALVLRNFCTKKKCTETVSDHSWQIIIFYVIFF
jgi:hypothetical protein